MSNQNGSIWSLDDEFGFGGGNGGNGQDPTVHLLNEGSYLGNSHNPSNVIFPAVFADNNHATSLINRGSSAIGKRKIVLPKSKTMLSSSTTSLTAPNSDGVGAGGLAGSSSIFSDRPKTSGGNKLAMVKQQRPSSSHAGLGGGGGGNLPNMFS